MAAKIKIKQVRSVIGYDEKQRATMLGLGLKRMHQERILENTPAVRGMIRKVQHLVTIEEVA